MTIIRRGVSWCGRTRTIWRLTRLDDELDGHHLVIPLVVITFVTGVSSPFLCNSGRKHLIPLLSTQALDAACYADLSTFAANQTGNVIIISVDIANIAPPGHRTLYNGLSLAGYSIAAVIAGQLGNHLGPRRRYILMISHATQVAILAVGLALLYADIIVSRSVVLLLLFATAAGLQVSQARQSGVSEIPTAMFSTPLVDLLVDPHLFKFSLTDPLVRGRNRRLAHIVSMIVGGFCGAFLRKAKGSEAVLLLAVIIKTMITAVFWALPSPAEEKARKEEDRPMELHSTSNSELTVQRDSDI
ncbi:hypothetical protein NliqN6_0183 [Naganishia liquefaciens]|uniref:DUF1275 domain-containing protein n=1 Tax=Naganishia liquefaciens TaxID=104408 RepID=A0A8H3TN58_9TREE|nr:hypothetical protein NliqN6_0183 [Naganishia liquefaciens]